MPKQLNVDLSFTADTAQARQQIKQLQSELTKLTTTSSISGQKSFGITKELEEATTTVAKLRANLSDAVNATTGKLDLTKFQQNMESSGLQIKDYKEALTSLGPEGTKAFASLAGAITQAEIPTSRINKMLTEMGTTLKNAARWQISSSILHGAMGAVQSAVSYAEKLDESLTNIRIVTGMSKDEMAQLAEQANKSAQALSTTTTAYTNAALIYYQQGLSNDEVKEMTDITLKMSNVTGESAEEVSSYMTAIWNNFKQGGGTLESFADKIAALGAATASSSEEIANGLQKFASLGSSLGLSYDDATAALATVVAQTRQSADTVGNSFRTLFQRMESLKLGETLEDGVDLTKYTDAMKAVGVQVVDDTGDLRDMHDVIMDLGAAWQGLSKAQQQALAQTVGGVRNSNTLIAWMDNFDKFQKNLSIARNSEGALDEQAERYADGWEAARKRVRASMEAIYNDIMDRDALAKIESSFANILKLVDNFIDGIGGLPGILTTVGTIAMTVFNKQIAQGLENAAFNIKMLNPKNKEVYKEEKKQANKELVDTYTDRAYESENNIGLAHKQQGELDLAYLNNAERLTEQEQKILQIKRDQQQEMIKAITLEAQESSELERQLEIQTRLAAKKTDNNKFDGSKSNDYLFDNNGSNYIGKTNKQVAVAETSKFGEMAQNSGIIDAFTTKIEQAGNLKGDDYVNEIQKIVSSIDSMQEGREVFQGFREDALKSFNALKDGLAALNDETGETPTHIKALAESFVNLSRDSDTLYERQDMLQQLLESFGWSTQDAEKFVTNLTTKYLQLGNHAVDLAGKQSVLKDFTDQVKQSMAEAASSTQKLSSQIVTLGSMASSIGMLYNQMKGLASIWSDKNASGMDKIMSSMSSIGMMVPTVMNLLDGKKWADSLSALKSVGDFLTGGSITAGIAQFAKLKETGGALQAVFGGLASGASNFGGALVSLVSNPVTLTIAAIAGLAFWGKKIYDDWYATTPEAKLKDAKAATEEASAAAKEAKDSYDNLKSTLESYDSAVKEISEMDDGAEKTEAINAQNRAILDAIKNTDVWKEHADEIKYDDDGLIDLNRELEDDSGTLEEILLKEKERENSLARQKQYLADINEIRANEAVEDKEAKFNPITTSHTDYIESYGTQGAQMAATSGGGTPVTTTTDVTGQILTLLAKSGVESVDANGQAIVQNTDANGETTLQNEDFSTAIATALKDSGLEANTQEITSQLLDILGSEEELKSLNQLIEQHSSNLDQINLESKSAVSEAFGDGFNSLDEESQNDVAKLYSTMDEDQVDKFNEAVENGNSLKEAFEAAGVAVDDLKLKLGDTGEVLKDTLDSDVDKEQFEALSKYIGEVGDDLEGLSDQVKVNKDAADDVAESILRFDSACEDVADNYEDWMDALDSGNLQDQAVAMQEMSNAYGDLLNIDGSSLSADFLANADNLELMKQAMEGDVDAYDQLQNAAMNDIIMHLDLDDGVARADVEAWANTIQQGIGDLEIGASIDDSQLIEQMNNIINSADMTAQQATDLLASMGVDAEVKKDTVPKESRQQFIEADPVVTYEKHTTPEVLSDGTISENSIEVPKISYRTQPVEDVANSTEEVTALRVTSARKSSGGGFKFTNSSHGGGRSGARAPSKSRGGGGGGSSKPKKPQTKKTKDTKKADEAIERYHKINKIISNTKEEVDKYSKEADRAFGKDKIVAYNKEIEKQEQLLANNNTKLAEAENWLKKDKAAAEKYNAQFDSEGNISNYEQVMQAQIDKYNAAVNAYNAAVANFNANNSDENEAAVTAADEAVSKAADAYKQFETDIKQYEETIQLIRDLKKEQRELDNSIYDNKLKITQYKVEVNVEVNDEQLALLDWQLKHLGEDADTANDRIANLGKQLAKNAKDIKEYESGLAEIFGRHNLDGITAIQKLVSGNISYFNGAKFTDDEWEAIKDYRDKIMDAQDDMADKFEDVHEIVKDTIDELEKDFEKITKQFDKYQKKYESLLNTINVLGKKTLGITTKDIVRLNQAMVDNALNVQRVAQDSIKTSQKFVLEAKAAYDRAVAAGNETAIKAAKETLDQAQEMLEDAQEQALESQADTLEKAQDAYEAYWENIRDDYQSLMGGQSGMDLDYLSDVFDRQKDINDMYLEDYEKYHELNALNSQIDKDMAAGLTTKMQSKYNDLLDDINAKMKDGAKISATEAETFKKRLAYLQAEAQLEDAKTAKTAVRMTRDNEGNFSYTYTADQNAIDAAEESVNNAAFDYIDYQRKYELQMNEAALDVMQEYYDKIEEITKKYQNDPSRLATAKAEVEQYYKEKLEYYLSEDKMIMSDMQRFRDDDLKDYEDMNNQKIASDESFITDFSQTILSQLLGYETLEEVMTNFANGQSMVSESSANAIAQFVANTQASLATSGQSAAKFAGDLTKTIEDTTQQSNETAVEAMQFDKVMNDQIQSVMDKTEEFDNLWSKKMNNMRDNTEKLVESINKLSEAAGSMTYDANSDAIGAGASGTRDLTGSSGADKRNIDTYQGILDRLNDNNYAQNRNNKLDALNESTLGTSVLNSIMDKVYASIDAMSNYMQANTAIGTVGSGLNNNGTLEQNVHIEASFPNVSSHNEIEEAFSNLLNSTSQFINRK